MGKKHRTKIAPVPSVTRPAPTTVQTFLHQALVHATGALGLLISISFFTATYDTAQVKLTLLHMGGLLLLALWGALQITRRQNPFTRARIRFWLPLLVYLAWNTVCYVFAPLHLAAAEEFGRFVLYICITLLAASEFDLGDVKKLTAWFLLAVWVSFLYAAVQIIDGFFPGFDPMPWRGFFTRRIFSTHANPNFFADFIIFATGILGSVYLITRRKTVLFLGLLGAAALFFTESKGAWLAYAAAVACGLWLYTAYGPAHVQKHRRKIRLLLVCGVLLTAVLVGIYTSKRFQSVSFRSHTWLGTLEMIQKRPLLGVGVGNFKTIYAAHRRPQIFYIESAHNIETQHPENELLEQAAVSGVVGLGIFLWLLYFLFSTACRTLKQTTPPTEKSWYLMGYTTALAGMCVHSLVDISIHFASSGFFFALFMGILLALCRPEETPLPAKESSPAARWLLYVLRAILFLGLATLDVWLINSFHQVTAVLRLVTLGETLLVASSWAVFIGCLIGANWILVCAACKLRSAAALLPFILLLPAEAVAYCPFQSNHLYSLAISLNNLGNLEGSMEFFTKAIALNPQQPEYRQFRANLFTVMLDLNKQFSPARGDKKAPADDYSRALNDFAFVSRYTPHHPLLDHNQGQLYYKMALVRSDAAGHAHSQAEHEFFKQEALDNMAKAKASFARALKNDPVNPETYWYLVQIGLLENNLDEAQQWLDVFYKGPAGVTEEEFLARNRNYPPMKQLQAQVEARRRAGARPVK